MEKTKFASLGDFVIIKTLGTGYNSKVKLAKHFQTGQQVAIKTIKKNHPKLNPKTIQKEMQILTELKHDNIVNLIEFHNEIDYVKKNGKSYKVVAIIMEFVPNGEIFEYIVQAKRFNEKVARKMFQTLIETLDYCNSQGMCHRDLKPENLLFDGDFNLKVADFGFATAISGKNEDGLLSTYLGTESYMAPELHLKQQYSGPSVDLFAAGIILFIMVAGTPPFAVGNPKNEHYKLICTNRFDSFWNAHEKNKPKPNGKNFFSEEFRDLINAMISLDPSLRLSIPEIKAHPWYKGPVVENDEIKKEFLSYKIKIDEEIKKQKEAKMQEKLKAKMQAANNVSTKAYSGFKLYRDFETAILSGETKINISENLQKRVFRQYDFESGIKASSCIPTILEPQLLFNLVNAISEGIFNPFTVSDHYHKIKGKAIKENGTIEMSVEVLGADDNTSCIEFKKIKGNVADFYEIIEEFRSKLPIFEIEEESESTQQSTTETLETGVEKLKIADS